MTRKQPAAASPPGGLTAALVALSSIAPDPNQPRKNFKPEELEGLAASIRAVGVKQPILLRPWPASAGERNGHAYMIVAGERRWRASELAGKQDIPAIIEELSDEEVLEIQVIENLQRADLGPMEEAESYEVLARRTRTTEELAARVGKSRTYVERRLSLLAAVEKVREALKVEAITLGHALEIARLPEVVQEQALAACFSSTRINVAGKWEDHVTLRSVDQLMLWISENVILDLKRAPWPLDDAELVPEQGPCATCQYNTAANTLFGDAGEGTFCTNRAGFKRKMDAWVARQAAEIAEGDGVPALYLAFTNGYGHAHYETRQYGLPEGTLGEGEFKTVEGGKKGRCEFARRGVWVHGNKRGQKQWVCTEPKCKDHLGRHNASVSRGAKTAGGAVDYDRLETLRERKQELFDARVAEEVRKRVFQEAADKFKVKGKWPFDRAYMNRIAAEFWARIPSDDQHVIERVFRIRATPKAEGNYPPLGRSSHEIKQIMKWVEALSDLELGRFMFVCSHAHLSANTGKIYHAVKMDAVEHFAVWHQINYRLIDAQVRLEMVPSKKYRQAHEEYLAKVEGGDQKTKRPLVYEPVERPKAVKASAKKGAAKKAAKKGKAPVVVEEGDDGDEGGPDADDFAYDEDEPGDE